MAFCNYLDNGVRLLENKSKDISDSKIIDNFKKLQLLHINKICRLFFLYSPVETYEERP